MKTLSSKYKFFVIPSQSGNIKFSIIGEDVFHESLGSDFSIKPFKLKDFSWKKTLKDIMENDLLNIKSFFLSHNKSVGLPPTKRKAPDYSLDTRTGKEEKPEVVEFTGLEGKQEREEEEEEEWMQWIDWDEWEKSQKEIEEIKKKIIEEEALNFPFDVWGEILFHMKIDSLENLYEVYLNKRGEIKGLIVYVLMRKKRILYKNRNYYLEFFKTYKKKYGITLNFIPIGYIFELDDLILYETLDENEKTFLTLPILNEKIKEIEITRYSNTEKKILYHGKEIYIDKIFSKIITTNNLIVKSLFGIEYIKCRTLTTEDDYGNEKFENDSIKGLDIFDTKIPFFKFTNIQVLKYGSYGILLNRHIPLSLKILDTNSRVVFSEKIATLHSKKIELVFVDLQEIRCSNLTVSINANLPLSLKTLYVDSQINLNLIQFPPAFKNLYTPDKLYDETFKFPKNLKQLETANLQQVLPKLNFLKITGALSPSNLDKFKNLKTFSTRSFIFRRIQDNVNTTEFISKFPPKLESLIHTKEIYRDEPILFTNLPEKLKILKLFFIHPEQKFPKGLMDLNLTNLYRYSDEKNPQKVRLNLREHKELKFLRISNFRSRMKENQNFLWEINSDDFPPNLEKFDALDSNFSMNIRKMPSTVRVLKLGEDYSGTISIFPENIKHLTLERYDKLNFLPFLPHSLLHIKFGDFFYPKIEELPRFLRTLKIGSRYVHTLPSLPFSLLELEWKNTVIDFKNIDHLYILKIHSHTIVRNIPQIFIKIHGYNTQKYESIEDAIKSVHMYSGYFAVHKSFPVESYIN